MICKAVILTLITLFSAEMPNLESQGQIIASNLVIGTIPHDQITEDGVKLTFFYTDTIKGISLYHSEEDLKVCSEKK